jgi:hypothetical protein
LKITTFALRKYNFMTTIIGIPKAKATVLYFRSSVARYWMISEKDE